MDMSYVELYAAFALLIYGGLAWLILRKFVKWLFR